MNLEGKEVLLRALELEDMEYLRELINDKDTEYSVAGWSFPVSKYQQIEWYKNSVNDKKVIRLAIENLNGDFIGVVDLRNIDWKNRTASHGIKILSHMRGKGYAKDIIFTIMKYVFEELQLNKLEANIIEDNEKSITLHVEKCGWKIEGIRRASIFKNNRLKNQVMIGILREEYLEIIDNLNFGDKYDDR